MKLLLGLNSRLNTNRTGVSWLEMVCFSSIPKISLLVSLIFHLKKHFEYAYHFLSQIAEYAILSTSQVTTGAVELWFLIDLVNCYRFLWCISDGDDTQLYLYEQRKAKSAIFRHMDEFWILIKTDF